MRRAHMLVLAIALAGAGLGFYGTDRDRLDHTTEFLPVEEASVRDDLERIVEQGALGGLSLVRRVPIEGRDPVEFDVEVDSGCAIVAAGAWDAFELSSLAAVSSAGVTYRVERRPGLAGHLPVTQHVVICPIRADEVRVRAAVRVAGEFAPGGGEVIVLHGEGPLPPIVSGRLVPIERSTVVRRTVYGRALMNAAAVFVLLGLFGIIVQVVLFRGGVSQDGQSSLRRLSLALPSEHRSTVAGWIDAIERGEVRSVLALRDHLVTHVDDVLFAAWQDDRAATRRMALRVPKVLEDLRRRERAASVDYRSRGTGWIVLTMVLQHECELPDAAPNIGRDTLAELLSNLLPADLGELSAARALLHPADPSQTFDDEALARTFPELRPIDRPSSATV